jgi:DNA-binding transcriptional MerR regulator
MQKNAHTPNNADPLPSTTVPTADSLLWEVLPSLHLNIVQTASLCGISVRQLGYWTKQDYVSATGHGARRMYGLDSLRRILAIKRAMTDGASLRQALRGLPTPGATLPLAFTAPSPSLTALSGLSGESTSHPLSPEEETALTAELLALFTANHGTRDNAAGLAVKIGRSVSDIQAAAEALSQQGFLSRTITGGDTVFQQIGQNGS